MAQRIEAVSNGEELIALLSELGPRHDAAQQALRAQVFVDQEIRDFYHELQYANGIWGVMQTYNRTWSGDRDALSREYQSIQDQMISFLHQLPAGSDKERLGGELTDVWAAMHQQENQAKR